jgi:putative FmdB family regulatory protein
MPIYEYVCGDCAAKFERLVRAWGERVSCPSCASAKVEKQLSSFAWRGAPSAPSAAPPMGGACCGGGCRCAH